MSQFLSSRRYPCNQNRFRTALGTALLAVAVTACPGPLGTGAIPNLLSTSPIDAATSVPLNAKLSATFDLAMTPLTASTFTLKQGSTVIAGSFAATADAKTTTLAPSSNLAASTVYTATITTEAKSANGMPLAAARTWTFTTGTTADNTAPVVSATSPLGDATSVPTNARVVVTFNKPMDPLSVTAANFTVTSGSNPVAGTVTYGPGTVATFTPANALATSILLTANVTTGVKDLEGNSLASNFSWSFTTGSSAALGPAAVALGTAANYVILAKAGISTVPASAITGDIGISPVAATYFTGFDLHEDATTQFATSVQLTGKAYASDYSLPTGPNLTTAVSNMQGAYTDAAGRPTPGFLELGAGNIGGLTLVPGLYKWTSTVNIPTDVTISGGANDVWIFQTSGDVTMSAAKQVTLSGGALAKNIFWQVAGRVTIGTGSHFEGVILCQTDVTLLTGASINGRILAQTQVALQQATVTQPAP